MLTRLLNWFVAWVRELHYRANYAEGAKFARRLLATGWTPAEVFGLPSMAPACMPNDAFKDGFTDALLQETRHAA